MRRHRRLRLNQDHTTIIATMVQAAFGNPADDVLIQLAKPSGIDPPCTGRMSNAIPLTIDHVASVTMNGCSSKIPIRAPLSTPTAAPEAMITADQTTSLPGETKCVAAIAVP